MNKLIGVVVAILVLAVAGVAGGAYWSGQQAERWYQEALAAGSKNPNLKLSKVRYDRGWFSSQAVTRIQMVPPEGSDSEIPEAAFSIRQDIYHGPLPLAGWNAPGVSRAWTGTVARTTLDLDSNAWTRELAKLYGGQEPIVAVSQIGFDGASHTHVSMPPLTLSNTQELQSLKFAGLQGQFQVMPHGSAVQGDMTVPTLEIVGKPTTADKGQPASGAVQVNLRDLTTTVNQRQGAFDLMLGDSNLKVGELRIQDPSSGMSVVFTKLGMDTIAALNPQNAQQVNVDVLFKADKITVDPWSGAGNIRLALHNLDGATAGQLQQWQEKMATNPNDPKAMDELLNLVKSLLRGKPELVLDTQAQLTQGDWQGKVTLNFQDFGEIDLVQNPDSLLGVLEKGTAEMTVSKTLAETVLTSLAREQLQTQAQGQGGKALDSLIARQVAEQLQGMTAAGFLRLEGDRYKATARFEDGKLLVNDQEIPLTSAAGLEDGATEDGIPLEPDGNPDGEEETEEAPR